MLGLYWYCEKFSMMTWFLSCSMKSSSVNIGLLVLPSEFSVNVTPWTLSSVLSFFKKVKLAFGSSLAWLPLLISVWKNNLSGAYNLLLVAPCWLFLILFNDFDGWQITPSFSIYLFKFRISRLSWLRPRLDSGASASCNYFRSRIIHWEKSLSSEPQSDEADMSRWINFF